MKKLIIISMIVLLPSCAWAWSSKDIAWFSAFTVTNTADFVLTYDAIKDPDKCEGNPILGDMDEDNIYYYYIGSELLILGIASLLPDEVRSNYFLIPVSYTHLTLPTIYSV